MDDHACHGGEGGAAMSCDEQAHVIEPSCERCLNERFCDQGPEPFDGCDFAPKTEVKA